MATLWRIDDEGAAAFARRFYVALRSRTPAGALAQAQRDLMSDSRYAHPYYWAGYVLTGDGLLDGGSAVTANATGVAVTSLTSENTVPRSGRSAP